MTLAVSPGDRPAENPRPSGPSSGLLRLGSIRWSLPASLITHAAVLALAVIAVGEPTRFEGKEEDAISIEIVSVEEVAAPDPSPAPSVAAAETNEPETPAPSENSPVAERKPVDPVEAKQAEAPVEEAEPAPPKEASEVPETEPLKTAEAPREIDSTMPTVLGHQGADATDPVPPPAEAVEPVERAAELERPPEKAAEPVEKAAELEPVPEEKVETEPKPKAERKPEKKEKAEKVEKGKKKPSGKALASAREGKDSAGGQRRKASGNASMSNYVGQIAAKLQRQKRYPDGAKRRGVAGTVLISFTITGSGAVTGSKLVRSSGAAELDQEVRAMLDRASPFPPIPDEMGRNSLTITVPIRFSLR